MRIFLSRDEIATITDCVPGAAQCKFLADHKILFIKDRNGLPHVTLEAVQNPQHLRFNDNLAHNVEPSFDWMD